MFEKVACKLGRHSESCGDGLEPSRICRRVLGRNGDSDGAVFVDGRWISVKASGRKWQP
jgi:hypothetical protein